MDCPEKKKRHGIITGIIVGGAVGSVLSLIFSTKKGREAAKNISSQALETGKDSSQKIAKSAFQTLKGVLKRK